MAVGLLLNVLGDGCTTRQTQGKFGQVLLLPVLCGCQGEEDCLLRSAHSPFPIQLRVLGWNHSPLWYHLKKFLRPALHMATFQGQ